MQNLRSSSSFIVAANIGIYEYVNYHTARCLHEESVGHCFILTSHCEKCLAPFHVLGDGVVAVDNMTVDVTKELTEATTRLKMYMVDVQRADNQG